MADNALRTTGTIGDWMTGGAAARAAGGVGSANAWNTALGGVANTANEVGRYYRDEEDMKSFMQNPALSDNYYMSSSRGRVR